MTPAELPTGRHQDLSRAKVLLRQDVSQAGIVLLLETVASVELLGEDGGAALRRRYPSPLLQARRAQVRSDSPERRLVGLT